MTLTGCKELWSDDMIVLPHRTFPYLGLEILQGKYLNMSQTANGFTIGGGLKQYSGNVVFPKTHEFAQDVFPVTISNATADALKVDVNTQRVFTFGSKKYTFNAVKVIHFTDNSESITEGYILNKNGAEVRWDEPRSNNSWNSGAKTNWQDSKTGTGTPHVVAMAVGSSNTVSIEIDMSAITEFDYVEFSTNTFLGNASTITIKNNSSENGKIVYKPYNGKNAGIGFGDWNGSSNKDFLPIFVDGGSGSAYTSATGQFNYYNKNETFVVAGAWNSTNSDEAILFMQNGSTQEGNSPATLENQAAVLLKRTDRNRVYSSSGKFLFEITTGDTSKHYFDYIAFFKKE